MQTYSATAKGPLKINGFIDPDDTTDIFAIYGPPLWHFSKVYRNGDIVKPTIDNGYYYICTSNGVSGANEPTWDTEETIDNTVTFTAVPWDLWLLPDETISTSSWTVDDSNISLSQNTHNDYSAKIRVSNVPASILQFTLTNQVTKNNGESLSRSFVYKVNQQ